MATYYARMLDAQTGGEGRYTFEATDGLIGHSARELIDLFCQHVEAHVLSGDVSWQLEKYTTNTNHRVVTAMGAMAHNDEPPVPFLLMISDQDTVTSRGT